MKRKLTCWMLILALLTGLCLAAGAETEEYILGESRTDGPEGSWVCVPVLSGGDSAICERVNAAIAEKARIDQYLKVLNKVTPGSTGLRVSWQANLTPGELPSDAVLSILIDAEGKMPQGRPGQAYHAITFDLRTGEELSFAALCADPDGTEAFLEDYVWDRVEPMLSDYMQNRQLSPVPTGDFWLDGRGNIVLYYPNDALSFLSGRSGGFAFGAYEAEGLLELSPDSVLARAMRENPIPLALTLPGQALEAVTSKYPCPLDSFFYAEGSAWLSEEPLLRGVWILSDREEERVTGVLITEGEVFGAICGNGRREELFPDEAGLPVDADVADAWLTVPGSAVTRTDEEGEWTWYFDTEDVLYAIRLMRR